MELYKLLEICVAWDIRLKKAKNMWIVTKN